MWEQTYQSINSLLIVVVPFTPFFTANVKQFRVRVKCYVVVGWAPQLVWTLWGEKFTVSASNLTTVSLTSNL